MGLQGRAAYGGGECLPRLVVRALSDAIALDSLRSGRTRPPPYTIAALFAFQVDVTHSDMSAELVFAVAVVFQGLA